MRAIVRSQFGAPAVLEIKEVAMPEVQHDTVLIQVRAFGLNHAELYMRRGAWGDVAAISGIECVGTVVSDATGHLQPGQTVAALMGGMGRSINGSYAQYTVVPAANVIPLQTDLAWDRLAALPETLATAWTVLHKNLRLTPGQRVVVRGGSSSLGLAAIALAAFCGFDVIATTRRPALADMLRAIGAQQVISSAGHLGQALESLGGPVDAVLDLLGNSTVLDSMRATKVGGHVCLAGFLGGLEPIAQFNPLSDMPSGVAFSLFASFNFGNADYPLADVPLQRLVEAVAKGDLRYAPARVFAFDDMVAAHTLMERGEANGKLVVVV